jgi:hypothetical protein
MSAQVPSPSLPAVNPGLPPTGTLPWKSTSAVVLTWFEYESTAAGAISVVPALDTVTA